ncbi:MULTISPECIES: TetR/AcrR family transcriptional regulator [unclassified Butyrivibrio]|uniref:TetR/AcrR family transcriptional regulator n=1 Tax=unclassified Butyrivibrio TaxID=2639466 RepID=UPI0003B3F8D4|nr:MULTISPECIES: TetR/AcrR family transcriptional regulator [unclassified Butyrivibrio]SEL26330.1 transcriptional regulator, TetR family [Butyrivibrio sp. ob235]
MNESDERYSTAEDAIIDSFFLLIREKDLEKITVADVIQKAGIVRSTFYNHYENIPALVTAAEDKTLDDIFRMMESFHPENDHDMCKSYFLAICNYTRNNPFLANLLESARGDTFFEKAMHMFHRYVTSVTDETHAESASRDNFSYLIAGTIGITIGILHKWIAEDFASPAENIADIMTKMFLGGVLPYLK